jgi:hypothetical protein
MKWYHSQADVKYRMAILRDTEKLCVFSFNSATNLVYLKCLQLPIIKKTDCPSHVLCLGIQSNMMPRYVHADGVAEVIKPWKRNICNKKTPGRACSFLQYVDAREIYR